MLSNNRKNELEIHVDVARQRLQVRHGDQIVWEAPVSTAKRGVGEEPNSHKTPRGWHRVAEKIGDAQPVGAVFKGRKPTGEIWTPESKDAGKNLVLTRILWLEGAEPRNATTKSRYIYFHGTNYEEKIGAPISKGCVCLTNRDMLKLYDYADVGTRVLIV